MGEEEVVVEASKALIESKATTEELSKEDKKEKKRKKKERKEKKASKKRKLNEQEKASTTEKSTTTNNATKESKSKTEESKDNNTTKNNNKSDDDTIKSLEQAYQKALQAFKADKTNKDLRRARTAAKKAWDDAAIAAAEPGVEALTCRNCSQLFLFRDQEKFQRRNWDKPGQCKNCVGRDMLKAHARNRSKLDDRQNMCYEFQKTGTCSRGDRCKFSHARGHVGKKKWAAIRARPLCRSIAKGEPCPHGDQCRFRHEKEVAVEAGGE